MTKYIVKPNYNGTGKRTFDNPKDAIKYYQDHCVKNVQNYTKMIGSVNEKLEEMKWVEKLEVVND
jgi:hypothetical protein